MSIEAMKQAMKMTGITPAQKVVLIAIADGMDEHPDMPGKYVCWHSHKSHANKVSMAYSTFRNHVKSLREAGVLETIERTRKNGSQSTNYILMDIAPPAGSSGTPPAGSSGTPPAGSSGRAPCSVSKHPITLSPKEETKEEQSLFALEQPTAKKSAGNFDEWYDSYPVKKSKGAARKAYDKALRKVTHERLMETTAQFVKSIDKSRSDWKAFTKHPSTWLNQECWDDESNQPPPPPTPHSPLEPTKFVFHERAEGFDPSKHLDWMNGGKA